MLRIGFERSKPAFASGTLPRHPLRQIGFVRPKCITRAAHQMLRIGFERSKPAFASGTLPRHPLRQIGFVRSKCITRAAHQMLRIGFERSKPAFASGTLPRLPLGQIGFVRSKCITRAARRPPNWLRTFKTGVRLRAHQPCRPPSAELASFVQNRILPSAKLGSLVQVKRGQFWRLQNVETQERVQRTRADLEVRPTIYAELTWRAKVPPRHRHREIFHHKQLHSVLYGRLYLILSWGLNPCNRSSVP
jgi:hypothetical protein